MFKVLLQKGQALFITEMCQIRKVPTTKKKNRTVVGQHLD